MNALILPRIYNCFIGRKKKTKEVNLKTLLPVWQNVFRGENCKLFTSHPQLSQENHEAFQGRT